MSDQIPYTPSLTLGNLISSDQITNLKDNASFQVPATILESPVDFNNSQLKQMPITADSIQLKTEYLAFDKKTSTSDTHAMSVKTFVMGSLSALGDKIAQEQSSITHMQVKTQHQQYKIAGTLVICISCAHKNAQLFDPLVLDVDKAVRAWNASFPKEMIDTNSPSAIAILVALGGKKGDPALNILSGITYGSSIIVLVHVLKTANSPSTQSLKTLATTIKDALNINKNVKTVANISSATARFSMTLKSIINAQNLQSHSTICSSGIKSVEKTNSETTTPLGTLGFDPATALTELSSLMEPTINPNSSMTNAIGTTVTLKKDNGKISTTSAIANINSYLNKIVSSRNKFGIPVHYILKSFSKNEIEHLWMAKYYPNKYNKSGSGNAGGN